LLANSYLHVSGHLAAFDHKRPPRQQGGSAVGFGGQDGDAMLRQRKSGWFANPATRRSDPLKARREEAAFGRSEGAGWRHYILLPAALKLVALRADHS
jgi:hypothetical protein